MAGRASTAVVLSHGYGLQSVKVNVYVDGFNLYYGCLKGTPYRWLNLHRPAELLLPSDEIHRIRYFTAFYRRIRSGALANSRFPGVLHDARGAIHRPRRWSGP
jgi:hypothetical protein